MRPVTRAGFMAHSGWAARVARERRAGRLLEKSLSISNHEVIMIEIMIKLMSHQGHSASDALVAGGRHAWRAWRASEAQAASRRPLR
jgi:hypothetical protein